MKLKSLAIATSLAALMSAGTALASDTPPSTTAAKPAPEITQKPATNPFSSFFDTSGWYDAAGHVAPGQIQKFNPMKPADWAKIPNPKTHTKMHMSATNPAHYGQYMTPEFAMQFADPTAWMALANPASYAELIKVASDPKTMQYWAQPGAYMHAMSPNGYTQMFNPANYMKIASVATESMTAEKGWGKHNSFNPFHWMKRMSESMTEATKTAAKATKERSE